MLLPVYKNSMYQPKSKKNGYILSYVCSVTDLPYVGRCIGVYVEVVFGIEINSVVGDDSSSLIL